MPNLKLGALTSFHVLLYYPFTVLSPSHPNFYIPRLSVFGELQARNEITVSPDLVVAVPMAPFLSLNPDGCVSSQEISYFYGSLMFFTVFTSFCIWTLTAVD
jgi:hypothetical protein